MRSIDIKKEEIGLGGITGLLAHLKSDQVRILNEVLHEAFSSEFNQELLELDVEKIGAGTELLQYLNEPGKFSQLEASKIALRDFIELSKNPLGLVGALSLLQAEGKISRNLSITAESRGSKAILSSYAAQIKRISSTLKSKIEPHVVQLKRQKTRPNAIFF